jgi:hypothetical protein
MSDLNRRQFPSYAAALPISLYLPINIQADSYSKLIIGDFSELDGDGFINKNIAKKASKIKSGDILSVAHVGRLIFSMGEDSYLLQGGSSLAVESLR